MTRVAVIGSGIAGLGTAWFLHRDHEVTIFEGDPKPGGHAHTVDVDEEGARVAVDTGFMVYNPVTYPRLVRLFRALAVPETGTEMSFSVQHRPTGVEYSGTSLNHLFAQRRNLLRAAHWRMLWAVNRFNNDAAAAIDTPEIRSMTLEAFVAKGGYGEDFLRLYLVPMASAVWSTPPSRILAFPAATLIRFFHNHGFLGLNTQHAWRTIQGGSRIYVDRLAEPMRRNLRLGEPVLAVRRRMGRRGVAVVTRNGPQDFDRVVLACHPPASLGILGEDATARERTLLACFAYQPNPALLHTDAAVMPRTRLAWSSWNYRYDAPGQGGAEAVSTHYWMNRLQRVSRTRDYFVSLNHPSIVDPARVLRRFDYEHPLFDRDAIAAQPEVEALNAAARGGTETYFAGAWQGYGFHEDGLASAERVARLVLGRDPWEGLG